MAFTFNGGTHPKENKNTREKKIVRLTPPALVSIPLSQHIGAPCRALVKPGDKVLKGQMIGDVENALGVPVHASVSGTVKQIISKRMPDDRVIENIIIENDFEDTLSPDIVPCEKTIKELTTDEIVEAVRRAGISGMGGATFPTYAKIASAAGKVHTMIINCCECEPYICANHRLMLENPSGIIGGAVILMKALGLRTCDIAIEDNKMDAVAVMEREISKKDPSMFNIRVMKTKYPQGDERQLIFALKYIEIPTGKLPADVGCIVFNAETCYSVYRALTEGMPLVERIVTVDGDCIAKPKNVLAPIGASYMDLIDFCGGLKATPKKIINGGPMMGTAQWDIYGSVTKGTSAVLVLSDRTAAPYTSDGMCIHCGKCVSVCPMHLYPSYFAMFTRADDFEECKKYDIMSCVECGSCTYGCPGGVPIVQLIRSAKVRVRAMK
ncbi:MAG: electron transport complex subunit RsxC [Clostridia bacterium]|jgi:electron transport complex protein RnfC|nr:electron transport complex subunit RsxC [Clostridia bacterium]